MEPRYSLEIKDATVAYNRVPAIHHLNLKIEGGHCVALMGPNGAGKTTLLRRSRLVSWRPGDHVPRAGVEAGANEIAYLPQREQVDGFSHHGARAGGDGMLHRAGMVAAVRRGATGGSGPGGRDDASAEPGAPADQRALGRQQQRAFLGGRWRRRRGSSCWMSRSRGWTGPRRRIWRDDAGVGGGRLPGDRVASRFEKRGGFLRSNDFSQR